MIQTVIYKKESLSEAATTLANGGIVAFPTETVYGLGADATNPEAVTKVFEAKERPSFDPLIVHITSRDQVRELVTEIPEKASLLMDKFWPGPLTIILPKKDIIPDLVTSGLNTVALRHPNHPIAQKLIELSGKPIAAPSANLFSRTSPTSAAAVLDMLDGRIDGVVDEGECEVGVESTVISFCEPEPTLFRPGGISHSELEEVIGTVVTLTGNAKKSSAPGRSLRHYAPSCPMYLDLPESDMNKENAGQLCYSDAEVLPGFDHTIVLSPNGDLRETAHNLYSALRTLGALNLSTIYATSVPERGVGTAVNDRLRRASENGFTQK